MKRFLPVVQFLCFAVILSACGKKEKLIGTWILKDVNIEKAISSFEGEQKEFARKMMQATFSSVKGKMKMTFFDTKHYTIETPLMNGDIAKDEGKWKLVAASKKLRLFTKDGIENHLILKLSEEHLKLEMEQAGFGRMEMTFEKE